MDLFLGFGLLIAWLMAMGLAADRAGSDSRPGPGDDHQRAGSGRTN
jgi:hypothetical protein